MSGRALILKGGGVKGLAFAGVVQELEAAGHKFEVFVGTSAGAIAAVLLATGFNGTELEAALSGVEFSKFRDAPFLKAWLINLPFRRWLYPGWFITQWLDGLLKQRLSLDPVQLRHLPKRAVVFAARRDRGSVVFDSEADHRDAEAAYAVRCSASIPVLFEPGCVYGHRVLDGGLLNNYPVDAFRNHEQRRGAAMDPDFTAVYLTTEAAGVYEPQSVFRDVLDIYLNRDDRFVVQQYRNQTIVVNPSPIRTTEFSISSDEKSLLLLRGRLAALDFLAARSELEAAAARAGTDPIQGLLATIKDGEVSALRTRADSLRPPLTDLEGRVRARRRRVKALKTTAAVLIAGALLWALWLWRFH